MARMDRVKRIMDLFVEGRECVLGVDDDNVDVLVWVNKPNSFEEEEARADGMAARSERMMQLANPEHPEVQNVRQQMRELSDDDLLDAYVGTYFEEDYLLGVDDVDSMEEWRDKRDYFSRTPELLTDMGVPESDPRWTDLNAETERYMKAIGDAVRKRSETRRAELAADREALEDRYVDQVVSRIAMDTFIAEKRVTEIFYALRDCQAKRKLPNGSWDHADCDHRVKLLDERSEVRGLPEHVIQKVHETLSAIEVDSRTAGNSDGPASSSASSDSSSAAEATSHPSTPEVTPSAPRTT